jgi:NAD(P)-dependent dehydrogenase (short-subunit alcohol dehydrogenase family)
MKHCIGLNDKSILVVGAAGRIGKNIVCAALEAGSNVVALDSNSKGLSELEKKYQDEKNLLCGVVDITSKSSIERMLCAGEDRFGVLDGAVNASYPRNANYGHKFFEVTYEDFSENLSLHLGGYFLFMQQCAKFSMDRSRKFSLVNMSSIYGIMAPRFDVYAGTDMTMPVEYAAIKAGLVHMTRYVNAYTRGVFRANCVSPGGILAGQDSEFLERYNNHCMTKGMLDSQDIVGAVLFLLSDASNFIVGQNFVVDDGFSL